MRKLILSVLVVLAFLTPVFGAWDFLYQDLQGTPVATRSSDPFPGMEWEYRVESLPVQYERTSEGFQFYVEYAGKRWTCKDGSIYIPTVDLPKTISKLDLLLVLRELDKMDAFLTWLDASGLKVFFDQANILSTDHPLYEQALVSVQQALGLSDEELQAILARIAK